jgi:hypothetical protein
MERPVCRLAVVIDSPAKLKCVGRIGRADLISLPRFGLKILARVVANV